MSRLIIGVSIIFVAQPAKANGDTPEVSAKGVTAKGQSVELVAVVRMDQKERFAWRPDGSRIEISEKWGPITDVRVGEPTHGFVFRCRGFEKGQDLGWRDVRATTPILKDNVPEFVSISAKLANDTPTTIRVGILDDWGPWQKINGDGTPDAQKPVPKTHRRLYQFVKSAKVFYGNAGALRTGFALVGVVGNKQVEELGEYEVAAVDGEGKQANRSGVGIWNGGQIPYFKLSEDDIGYFEYRMRPYMEWITFEKIPLKPGKSTPVEITVTKAEPEKK